MSPKIIVSICVLIFSTIGGYIPVFFGADLLSLTSLIGNGVGAILGLYIGYKLNFQGGSKF